MRSSKLVILVLACCFWVVSCNQSAPEPNTKRAVANTTATTNTASNLVKDSDTVAKGPESVEADVTNDDIGLNLYAKKCMICHKDSGKGGKVTLEGKTINAADLTSARIRAKSDEKLLSEVKAGVPDEGMPAFRDKLSDAEIKLIIEKIRQFKD